ncbi:MAG: hypothetical protein ACXAC5_02110 [Promethearchaeota archaeon]
MTQIVLYQPNVFITKSERKPKEKVKVKEQTIPAGQEVREEVTQPGVNGV